MAFVDFENILRDSPGDVELRAVLVVADDPTEVFIEILRASYSNFENFKHVQMCVFKQKPIDVVGIGGWWIFMSQINKK